MINNPYPIQIKKRILLNLIYGVIKIIIICLIFGLFLFFTSPSEFRSEVFMFSTPFVIVLGGIMIAILVFQIIWNLLYLNSIEYSLDNKNITFKGGVISRFEKIIPYSKIQHVIIYESFWQRVLGLSSVSIETARESGFTPHVYGQQTIIQTLGPFIPDLNSDEAEKFKNYIISVSNKKYKSIAGI